MIFGHLSVVEGEVEEQLGNLSSSNTSLIVVNGFRIHGLDVGVVIDALHKGWELSSGADDLSHDSFGDVGGVEVSDEGDLVKESTKVADSR